MVSSGSQDQFKRSVSSCRRNQKDILAEGRKQVVVILCSQEMLHVYTCIMHREYREACYWRFNNKHGSLYSSCIQYTATYKHKRSKARFTTVASSVNRKLVWHSLLVLVLCSILHFVLPFVIRWTISYKRIHFVYGNHTTWQIRYTLSPYYHRTILHYGNIFSMPTVLPLKGYSVGSYLVLDGSDGCHHCFCSTETIQNHPVFLVGFSVSHLAHR